MALRLFPTGKTCRFCGSRLQSRIVDHTLTVDGADILYHNVRHYSCPKGCGVSEYDLSKAKPAGPPSKRTLSFMYAYGAAPAAPPATKQKGGAPVKAPDESAQSQQAATLEPAAGEEKPAESAAPAVATASEAATATQPAEASVAASDPAPSKTDRPVSAERPARPARKAASEDGEQAPAKPIKLKNVKQPPPPPDPEVLRRRAQLSLLGRIYVYVGLAFSFVIVALGIVLSGGTPAIKMAAGFLFIVASLYLAVLLFGRTGTEESTAQGPGGGKELAG